VIRHSTGIGALRTRRWSLSILGNLVLWAIIAVDAWFLWPTSLGGGTTLIIVSGDSMAPALSDGDLVVAREGEVGPGDIVVYEPTDLGGVRIVHRVVGGDGEEGWLVKGDNNGWVDQWSPTSNEVIGRMEFHFDGAGRVASFLVEPWLWCFVLLGAVVMILWPETEEDRHHLTPVDDATVDDVGTTTSKSRSRAGGR